MSAIEKKPKQTIGKVTTYIGQSIPWLRGQKVKIVAVYKNRLNPSTCRGDEWEGEIIDSDADLDRVGGVGPMDMIEVRPWIEKEGRFSWVTADPAARELECFQGLAR